MLKKLEAVKAYINKHVAMLIVIMGPLLTSTLFILIRSTNLYIMWLTMTIPFIIFNIRTVIYILKLALFQREVTTVLIMEKCCLQVYYMLC